MATKKQTLTKAEIEKMYGKCFANIELTIDDDLFNDGKEHKLNIDVYDGFAYCPDHEGEEYFLQYPQLGFIKISDKMQETIREYNEMDDKAEITPVEVIATYGKLYKV